MSTAHRLRPACAARADDHGPLSRLFELGEVSVLVPEPLVTYWATLDDEAALRVAEEMGWVFWSPEMSR